jgi:hypothetical protein
VIFPAPSASAAEEIEAPNGFGDAKDWAVVFNFEWVDENDDSECDSPECYFLRDAHDRKFLTRAYDIDDAGEADMASAGFVSGGYGYANFIPVDYPWLRNQDGGHGNFPDGIYPH